MESKTIATFQIIGACVKMQTVSWDDEIKLTDGIPYNINFYRDFSTIRLNGRPITDMPIASIIESIRSPAEIYDVHDHVTYSAKDRQHSQEFWEQVDKFGEKEKKLAKKWKRGKKKRALNRENFLRKLESCEYCVNNKD